MEKFKSLVLNGHISDENLGYAANAAADRRISMERILRHEYNIPRRALLEAMSKYFGCAWIEYDERLAVPPELLAGLDRKSVIATKWFPVTHDGGRVIIAANDPSDPGMIADVNRQLPEYGYEIRVAICEDLLAFYSDFLNASPEHLSGNERTGLAYWRNNMARWRTRLACYRTDFAIARTRLSLLRGGLGLITIGRTMMSLHKTASLSLVALSWCVIAAGLAVSVYGLVGYFRLKISMLSPPGQQTLVEVSSSAISFFEGYQFIEKQDLGMLSKKTMLARLADTVSNYGICMDESFDNKIRSGLAHERNILAAQRTVLSCYRTIFARARVGLSFMRTGVAFSSIALGLMKYFGLNMLTFFDFLLLAAGIGLIADGLIWYWPVHMEQHETSDITIMN